MKTTLELPDDLATIVKLRAARDGREMADEVVDLLRKGLAAPDNNATSASASRPVTDPSTGLPLIESPADAPIHQMTVAELDALVQRTQAEEDLERAGLSLRR